MHVENLPQRLMVGLGGRLDDQMQMIPLLFLQDPDQEVEDGASVLMTALLASGWEFLRGAGPFAMPISETWSVELDDEPGAVLCGPGGLRLRVGTDDVPFAWRETVRLNGVVLAYGGVIEVQDHSPDVEGAMRAGTLAVTALPVRKGVAGR
ncbi:hypothetical protein ACQPZP_40855 [Spirillospora sp. CA-142024]|uniref:hypothetical protein n=1 Tax=Spirillospora sp. CA-142024 TaxID=3240036 RepID=UPI003D8F4D3E